LYLFDVAEAVSLGAVLILILELALFFLGIMR
jgi:hypothetical protein